ncbi:MAG: hypothetical protein ACYCW6_01775 [Candidatus Xenobia bacterium]
MKKLQFKGGNIILGTTALSTLIALAGCGGGGGSMGMGTGSMPVSSSTSMGSVAIQVPRKSASVKFSNVASFNVTLAGQTQNVPAGNASQTITFSNVPAGPQTLVVTSTTTFGTTGPGTSTPINVVANTTTSVTATLSAFASNASLKGTGVSNTFFANGAPVPGNGNVSGNYGRTSGTLTADGNGNFSFSGEQQEFDGVSNAIFQGNGTYTVATSGAVTGSGTTTNNLNNNVDTVTLNGHVNDDGDVVIFTETITDATFGTSVAIGASILPASGTSPISGLFAPFVGVAGISDSGGTVPAVLGGGGDVIPASASNASGISNLGTGVFTNVQSGTLQDLGGAFTANLSTNGSIATIPGTFGSGNVATTSVLSAALDVFAGQVDQSNGDRGTFFFVNDPGNHTVADMQRTYGVEVFIPDTGGTNGNVSTPSVVDGTITFDGNGNVTALQLTGTQSSGNATTPVSVSLLAGGNHSYSFVPRGNAATFQAILDINETGGGSTGPQTIVFAGSMNPRNNVLVGSASNVVTSGNNKPALFLMTQ